MSALEKYNLRVGQSNSLLCIGLDSDLRYLPRQFRDETFPQFAFNRWLIDQTNSFVCAYKPNLAFYEARGDRGMSELKMTMDYLQERYPAIFTICDAKRADVGTTNVGYVESIFDWLGFDAVTLQPYIGKAGLQVFLEREDKCAIILCRTSNHGAQDLQDWMVGEKPLWQVVAQTVAEDWNDRQNCMLVVNATYPPEVKQARELVGDMPLLLQGVGTQSNSVRRVVEAGLNSAGLGLIVSLSRSIIFTEEPNVTARRLRDEINQSRPK